MAAVSDGLSTGWHIAPSRQCAWEPIGMPVTAWCTGTGGSEIGEATEVYLQRRHGIIMKALQFRG